jgi:methionyl-tRNA formyltransferase
MVDTLHGLERGELSPRQQDSQAATMAPILKKEDGRIEWTQTAEEVARRTRGLRPWPGAFTTFRGAHLTLWMALPTAAHSTEDIAPGTLVVADGKLMVVCGGCTLLEVKELQLAGRKRVSTKDFLNGIRLKTDDILK